ncbi:AP-3 complex subunit mu-1 [Aphelenchoides fujianensis]|nr:AP-3 complex subunit mu-1 [Aphelenchoides fujianensis]
MLNSLFIVNVSGDIILEKHYKSFVHRSICDYFFDAQKKVDKPDDVPPVIPTPHHYLFNIYRNNLYLIAVTVCETSPLMIFEILHHIVNVFTEYFDECTDTTIKENIVTVFEVLDEMLDNGHPLTTELNVLQDLIKPPNFLRSITNQVIEEIDAIIDKQGSTVSAEIQGYINCCCKLSGMPDLTMSLMNPRILEDVSFHPLVGIPLFVRHSIHLKSGTGGRIELTVGPKQNSGKLLEEVVLEMNMPKPVQNCNLTASHGKYSFDPTTKVLQWVVGKIEIGRPPTLKGSVSVVGGSDLESPPISVKFRINQLAISGLKVNRLDMYSESYKPFKGVKYVTKAGRFPVPHLTAGFFTPLFPSLTLNLLLHSTEN